ncbi:hypothetical protein MMC19_003855 [Ptychographa xylographoides]|nr:hypothetical protein [Ptychographa xylographoides]
MGQGTSKSSPPSTQHVFLRYVPQIPHISPAQRQPNKADRTFFLPSETPVRFSQELIDSLQASPETDSTRAKDLELHIQTRVTAELTRLEAESTRTLHDLAAQISATPDTTTTTTHTGSQPGTPDQSASLGGTDHGAKAQGDRLRDLGRQSVQQEIEALRAKLQRRKMREDVVGDKGVEKARGEVVTCLRVNDRRPLDCWREVEAFKREVGRLEKGFLGRVME